MEWLFDDEEELITAIDFVVGEIVAETAWEERVAALTPETPFIERLTLYRELRDSAVCPSEESFFLIGWTLEEIAGEQIHEVFKQDFEARFELLEKKYHIDPEEYIEAEMTAMPEEYEALNMEFFHVTHAITLATIEKEGEQEMAALYHENPEEYGRRYLEGGEALLGWFAEECEEWEEEEEEL